MENYVNTVNKWVERNKELILNTISDLVRIRTENLPPDGREKAGQEYLCNFVKRYIPEASMDIFNILDVNGIRKHPDFFSTVDGVEKIYKNRPNLMVKLPGKGNGRSMLFSGHIDTMSVKEKKWNVFSDPYSGKVKNGRMYGRGVLDMKAGLASGFLSMKCINDLKIRFKGDIFAESVIDEEYGGVNGTIANRLKYPGIDFAILSEPSGLICGVETKGGTDFKITVLEEGVGGITFGEKTPRNPMYKLAKIIVALKKFQKYLNRISKIPENYKKSNRLELLVYQVSSGGKNYLESQSIPLEGHIYLWFYTYEYMKEKEAKKIFIDFMRKELSKNNIFNDNLPSFEKVIRYLEGHRTDVNSDGLKVVRNSFSLLGIPYKVAGLNMTCDAYAFKKIAGTEVVVLGPKGGNPHGMDEYVEIESIYSLIKIMVSSALSYCC